jgi:alpha-tubulin suppressor-like RCC1 family protein
MVACGQLHTLALIQAKGQVYAWGSNSFGQLGLGNNRSINTPTMITEIASITMRFIAAGSFSGAISHEKGELFLWGTGTFGEFPIPQKVKTSP